MSNPSPLAPAMMAAYTDLMKTFLNVQRDVMIAALGGQVSELPAAISATPPVAPAEMQHGSYQAPVYYAPPAPSYQPVVTPAPIHTGGYSNGHHTNGNGYAVQSAVMEAPAPVAPSPVVESTPAPVMEAAPELTGITDASLTSTLVDLVAERTGYPAEMVELDLDLEADLGIDSIKRVEILGSFQKQFGNAIQNVEMDDLTEKKSIREIVDYVLAQQN